MYKKLGFVVGLVVVSLMLKSIVKTEEISTNESPLALHLYPQNQQVKEGEKVAWYLTTAGAEPIQYQWKLNGKEIPKATGNTLQIASAKISDQGIYTCALKNKFGAMETEPVQLSLLNQGAISTAQKINSSKAPVNATAQKPNTQP